MKKMIVFDFDGVLADSFETLYRLNEESMREVGIRFSKQDYRDLFDGNIHLSLQKIIRPSAQMKQFRAYKAPLFAKYYKKAVLYPFAGRLVRDLSKKYRLAIVSSTAEGLIRKLLRLNRLEKDFSAVLGALGTSKEKEVKKAIRMMGGKSCRGVHFVSDTSGDLRLGRKLQMKTLGVSWGFHGLRSLRAAKPEKIFRKPQALRNYLLKAA